MRDYKTIGIRTYSVLTLGLHADMQMRIYAAVKDLDPTKIFLTADDFKKWKEAVELESDVARVVRKSVLSETMAQKDEKRTKIVRSLFSEIRVAGKSPIEEREAAGKQLIPIVNTYHRLVKENMGEKTAHIEGMMRDLSTKTAQKALEALKLKKLTEMLEEVNTGFKKVREDRAEETTKAKLPSSDTVRAANNVLVQNICKHLEAAYLVAATDEDKALIGQTIDKINLIIKETLIMMKERRSQLVKKPKKPKPGKGGNKKWKPSNPLLPKNFEEMLKKFEEKNNFAPGTWVHDGITEEKDGVMYFSLYNAATKETIFVKVENSELVKRS